MSKKEKSKLSPEDKALVVEYINKSRSCVNTVLARGSAMANELNEVDDMGRDLGQQLGLKQEHWYSDFE